MSTVQRGGPHAGNQRTSWQRVPPFRTSHREKNSKLHDQPTGRPSAKRARTTNGAAALQTSDEKLSLVQQPAGDWTALADTELLRLSGTTIHDGAQVLAGATGTVQRIDVNFTPGSAEEFGLILRGDRVKGTRVGIRPGQATLLVDRRESGRTDFHASFSSIDTAPVLAKQGSYDLTIFVDRCSVEVFAQDGQVTMTELIFPAETSTDLAVYAVGGAATINSLQVTQLG